MIKNCRLNVAEGFGAFDVVSNGHIVSVIFNPSVDSFSVRTAIENREFQSDGVFAFDAGEFIFVGDRPSSKHNWSWVAMNWVASLSEEMNLRWQEIKAIRSRKLDEPLVTPHGTFDCSKDAQTNIIKAALKCQLMDGLGLPSGVTFTTADNVRREFSMSEMVEVALLMGQREQAIYDLADSLRQQINAATSPEEVKGVQWPSDSN